MNQPFVPLWRRARRTRALAGGGFDLFGIIYLNMYFLKVIDLQNKNG
jgi:hypothetical protein